MFLLSGITEVLIPADDLEKSKEFYQVLEFEVAVEHEWGMIQMKKENGPSISLITSKFFKNTSMGFVSKDLDQCVEVLQNNSINIAEDDRKSEPARIVFKDPSGFEIHIFGS